MKTLVIPQHTVVMMIGPSNCGKSYFCNNKLLPYLETVGTVKYLSSDDLRRELLHDKTIGKHDRRMMPVSKQAFSMLNNQLDNYTQYPVNTDVVIVDSTNLSVYSRNEIAKIAQNNGYGVIGVVFDYKNEEDYTRNITEDLLPTVIEAHIKDFKKTVLDLKKTKFDSVFTIESIDEEVNVTYAVTNIGKYITHKNVCVIADLHGCYDELLTVLQDNKGITIDFDQEDGVPKINYVKSAIDSGKYVHHVLVGDIVDKGPKVEELVRFLHKNSMYFVIVEGNHDRWNFNYLKGIIKGDNDQMITDYFQSVRLFEGNEELKELFFDLYKNMGTFAYNEKLIVTHAPVKVKHLGKTDKVSSKAMNTIRYPKEADYASHDEYVDAIDEYFQFLKTESSRFDPYHVFGHICLPQALIEKNKYGIDTGCYAGGKLTTFNLYEGYQQPIIRSYASKQPKTKEFVNIFKTKKDADTQIVG